jgi:predicted RND superfamily exporter protein
MVAGLLAGRWFLLLVGIALLAVCAWPAGQVQFDRSIENMFAPDDPLLVPYQRLKRTFGGNEVVVAVYADPELLDPSREGIRRLAEISEALKQTPGVHDVLSLAQLDAALAEMGLALKIFGLQGPSELGIVDPDNKFAARFRQLFEGYTHGSQGRTAAVICMLQTANRGPADREQTVDLLREKIRVLADGMVAGEPVMVADSYRYVEQDGRRLGWVSTVLLSLLILVCFRSIRWMVLAVAVVQLALLTTRTLLAVSGLRLSMVSSMLTAIVTVVGVATVVHIIVRFRESRLAGLTPDAAFLRVGVILAAPIFWACTTDAVGFASLLVADVGPVRDFGLMMAMGSLMVLTAVVLFGPGLIRIGPHPDLSGRADSVSMLEWGLGGSVQWLRWRPRLTLLLVLGLVGGLAAGAFRLELETDFTKNFRSGSPIVQAYETIEQDLGGAGVWDVVVPAPAVLDSQYLTRIRRLQQRLENEIPGDPRDALPAVQALSLGDGVWAALPKSPERSTGLARIRAIMAIPAAIAAMKTHLPALAAALHGEDPQSPGQHYYRIMLRSKERQAADEKRALIEDVQRIVHEEFPEAEVTGFFVLLTNLIDSVVRDQWTTFGVALAGIGITMLLAFRHPGYAVIALIPNALPILTVTGLMGWAGLKVNMGAAMIAAVSMGLSVDSSIHYITFYRRARAAGHSVQDALLDVQRTVGRAVVLSTLALVTGFAVLSTSQFVPTIYFGIFVSLAMLGGLAGNLVVLPLLLQIAAGRPRPAGDD